MCDLSVLFNNVCITNRNQNPYERDTFIEGVTEIQDLQQTRIYFLFTRLMEKILDSFLQSLILTDGDYSRLRMVVQ